MAAVLGQIRNKYEWLSVGKNIPAAASGLRLRSRDLLKLGMLLVNNGRWKNAAVLSQDWVTQSLDPSIKRPSSKDSSAGYAYQMWTFVESVNNKNVAIQEAKGNGGQRIFICKSLGLLVIITAGNYNNWDIINDSKAVLLKYIIPAIQSDSFHQSNHQVEISNNTYSTFTEHSSNNFDSTFNHTSFSNLRPDW